MAKLRKDPAAAKVVQKALDDTKMVQRRIAEGKADRRDMAKALSGVVTHSGFNYGLLVPHIFPSYPQTEPLSLIDRPFMFAMTTMATNTTLTLRAGRQIGKCVVADTLVDTETHGKLSVESIYEMGCPSK